MTTRKLALFACLLLVATFGRAAATPRLPLHPVGLGFDGPTEPELTSLWWNPAAVGELAGTHLAFSFHPTMLFSDVALGQPSSNPASISSQTTVSNLFAALSTDFGTEHVRFGFSYAVPFWSEGSTPGSDTLDPRDDSPLRYALLHSRLRHHYFTPTGIYRINSSVSFGVGMNIVWSDGKMQFARCPVLDGANAACTNPSADEVVSAKGTHLAVGFSIGFLWRILGRLTLGGSVQIRPGLGGLTMDAYDSATPNILVHRLNSQTGAIATEPRYGRLEYDLPHLATLGIRWRLSERWEGVVTSRYAAWGQLRPFVRIASSGSQGAPSSFPSELLVARGYRDSFAIEVRPSACITFSLSIGGRCRLRIGVLGAFETGAIRPAGMTAGTLFGPEISGGLVAEWTPRPAFRIQGGALYSVMLPRAVEVSQFDTAYASGCAASGFALAGCREAAAGLGSPSQAGNYGLSALQFGVQLAVDFWPAP